VLTVKSGLDPHMSNSMEDGTINLCIAFYGSYAFINRVLVYTYCRMDLPGPTTSVGTGTDYSVSPWDYSTCDARHLLA
jgi:hypothetical protein